MKKKSYEFSKKKRFCDRVYQRSPLPPLNPTKQHIGNGPRFFENYQNRIVVHLPLTTADGTDCQIVQAAAVAVRAFFRPARKPIGRGRFVIGRARGSANALGSDPSRAVRRLVVSRGRTADTRPRRETRDRWRDGPGRTVNARPKIQVGRARRYVTGGTTLAHSSFSTLP